MIIVIGATSFMGVHTVTELLNQRCEVLVTGRKNRFKEHYDALSVKYETLTSTMKRILGNSQNQVWRSIIDN